MVTAIVITFLVGYLLISIEHSIGVNKSATALVMAGLSWIGYNLYLDDIHAVLSQLEHHLASIAEIMLFLVGAMTIVELIDAHNGFQFIANHLRIKSKRKLLWAVGFISFILSAILDNLTTSIVMVSLLRKFIGQAEDRKFFAGIIIIAANAGGAFSPIGDVTTTMLWVSQRISTTEVIIRLFLPSVVCLLVPLIWLHFKVKGSVTPPEKSILEEEKKIKGSLLMLVLGTGILISVPIFKTVTHLPPYLGMLLGLGIIWLAADVIHKHESQEEMHRLSAHYALTRIDVPSILFFFGILASVAVLEEVHVLSQFAHQLNQFIPSEKGVALALGIVSSIVDNVPLVAASMGMYPLQTYPMDSSFWHLIAYCAGTGGSLLIIGSAAGVTVMGMEKITFSWYLKNITLLALAGYLAGIVVYVLLY
ncbi:MAG: sodium:proton antiporter NhaD [Bacteroidia bacterium]|nr:sodium:proton antiporter NhaD [Bacteroidia bacterium]MDW8302209.1 sodium:proton antiporter NhaD [Bacteroidia bacterium]